MVIFTLPAYNEAENLPALLGQIEQVAQQSGMLCRVVLVDDGSTDGTGEVALACRGPLSLRVVRHAHNLGLAATLRDALKEAVRDAAPDDVVVTMDADDTHEPSLARQMVSLLTEQQPRDRRPDVVIASRYAPGGREVGLPWHRHLLSRCANTLLKVVFPIAGVRDYTSGYRAVRASLLRHLLDRYDSRLIESRTFCATAEVLLKLRPRDGRKLRVAEVPLVLRYDHKRGVSKMRIWPTIVDYARLIARLRPWIVPLGLCVGLAGLVAWLRLRAWLAAGWAFPRRLWGQ